MKQAGNAQSQRQDQWHPQSTCKSFNQFHKLLRVKYAARLAVEISPSNFNVNGIIGQPPASFETCFSKSAANIATLRLRSETVAKSRESNSGRGPAAVQT